MVFIDIQIGLHAVFQIENIVTSQTFLQGCHIQQLITLRDFVIEASSLQFLNGQ